MKKLFLLILPTILFCKCFDPYYTGPLITPSANNLYAQQWFFQPYVFVTDAFARYDSSWHHHSVEDTITVNPSAFIQYGLTNYFDLTLILNAFYNKKHHQKSFKYGDTGLELGIQLLRAKKDTWIPAIRLLIKESFPTGKYEKLNPYKKGVDSSGSGSYETSFYLNIAKTVCLINPVAFRISLGCTIPTDVNVKEFNTYGGGYNTDGKVTPGYVYTAAFAFEYSFTQKFAYAMDVIYAHANRVKFKGINGTNEDGSAASNVSGSSEQWSLAPALEYNFSEDLGVIAGLWFSVKGKNTIDFISYVASLTWLF